MGAEDFAWADRLRRAHFPPERNFIPAHITLFHHLPPSGLGALRALIGRLALAPAPKATIEPPVSLGRGVAFIVRSPELLALRDEIAHCFADSLIPQDRARPRLHITVQNKVPPDQARATLAVLNAGFRARPLVINGLALWFYRGGPWEPIHHARFRGH